MRSRSYATLERLTSDRVLPVVQVLEERREELRRLLVEVRDHNELVRIQGRAAEVDLLLSQLLK